MGPGCTRKTKVKDDNDVEFLLAEERGVPQVCATIVERELDNANENVTSITEPVCNEDIAQQFVLDGGSNQVPLPTGSVNLNFENVNAPQFEPPLQSQQQPNYGNDFEVELPVETFQ